MQWSPEASALRTCIYLFIYYKILSVTTHGMESCRYGGLCRKLMEHGNPNGMCKQRALKKQMASFIVHHNSQPCARTHRCGGVVVVAAGRSRPASTRPLGSSDRQRPTVARQLCQRHLSLQVVLLQRSSFSAVNQRHPSWPWPWHANPSRWPHPDADRDWRLCTSNILASRPPLEQN